MHNPPKRRGPVLNLDEMGIPDCAILQYVDGEATAQKIHKRHILFNGEVTYLNTATSKLLGRKPRNPCRYWTYNGTPLHELWEKYRDAVEAAEIG
jgi:hypothetical protein